MLPIEFEEQNIKYGHPPDLEESQCHTIPAHKREITKGSCDGLTQVIVAWKPTKVDIDRLNAGGNVYLSMIGGLAPHFLTTSFVDCLHVA